MVLQERLHPYFAYHAPNKKYFKMVLAENYTNMKDFALSAHEKALLQADYFIRADTAGRSDLIFISSIPTVSFTHLSHTITLSNKEDTIPRLSWGKYFEDTSKVLMPINVQAHHSFVDGEHMGMFFNVLQDMLVTY